MLLFVEMNGRAHVLAQTDSEQFEDPTPSPDGRYLSFAKSTVDSNAWIIENF